MSKPFDYSKWDNIELSDDEDDVHPNIDRESWFRMKHRSRVEREEREEADKKKIREEMAAADLRIKEITRTLADLDAKGPDDDDDDDDDDDLEDRDGLTAELEELRKANTGRQTKLDEYEKNKKWNVDNMCHVVEERTIINPKGAEQKFSSTGYALPNEEEDGKSPASAAADDVKAMSLDDLKDEIEEEKAADEGGKKKAAAEGGAEKKKAGPAKGKGGKDGTKQGKKSSKASSTEKAAPAKKAVVGPERERISMMSYHEFTEKYADRVEEFMAIRDLGKTREFLLLHGDVLLQENASNYLLLASLEDEMNGFREKMKLTARQSQVISNIAELAKSLRSHPGNVIIPFFQKLDNKEFLKGFLEGVEGFVQRIIKRAVDKKKEIDAERAAQGQEEGTAVDLSSVPKEERLGPGGLDPVEVFESLPQEMQAAFESREVEQLKEALMKLEPSEAEYHMKRCVDSGLWNE